MAGWFAGAGPAIRDENVHVGVPSKRGSLSKRQVLASLDNLPSDQKNNRKASRALKILVIGNSKCGKTSIIRRYTNDSFTEDYNITIGADYTQKVVEGTSGDQIRLQLWDIAGQDRFAMLTRPYFRNACAAVIVCDVTRPLTLDAVRDWKRELDEKMASEGEIPCILLANKCDQLKGVQEALEIGARIENICTQLGFAKWFITSAKSNENITDAMSFLLTTLTQSKATGSVPSLKDIPKDQRRSSLKLGNGNLKKSEEAAQGKENAVDVTSTEPAPVEGGCSLA